MKRIILTYGIVAGLVIIVTNTVNMEYGRGQAWLGFLVMFIAFSSIYVAVRQYRDQSLGGVISFTTALLVGLGISAVAGVVYVGVWEAYLAATDFGFIDAYVSSMLEAKRQAGASDAEIAKAFTDAEQFREQYANPLIRVPITFLEVFPVGLLVSLVTAGIHRYQN